MKRLVTRGLFGFTSFGFAIAACVGDDPAVDSNNDGSDASGDASQGDAAPSDGSSGGDSPGLVDAGKDSGPKCGYAGESCCTPPQLVCNQGTACVSGTCRVNDVWVLGDYPSDSLQNIGASAHFDGTSWTKGPEVHLYSGESNGTATGAWGFTPDAYYATASLGYVEELAPSAWETCGSPASCFAPTRPVTLQAIYGFATDDYWIGGVNTMIHCASAGCAQAATGLPGGWGVGNFSGTSSKDLWFTQTSTAYHYDGSAWTAWPTLPANAIWEIAPNDVWVGGNGSQLAHFDGSAWSSVLQIVAGDSAVPGNIYTMSGSDADDIWAAGYDTSSVHGPFSLHWDGTNWSFVPVPLEAGSVASVFAAGHGDAFLVGSDSASVFRWNGTAWTAMTMPPASAYPDAGFGLPPSWSFAIGTARPRRP